MKPPAIEVFEERAVFNAKDTVDHEGERLRLSHDQYCPCTKQAKQLHTSASLLVCRTGRERDRPSASANSSTCTSQCGVYQFSFGIVWHRGWTLHPAAKNYGITLHESLLLAVRRSMASWHGSWGILGTARARVICAVAAVSSVGTIFSLHCERYQLDRGVCLPFCRPPDSRNLSNCGTVGQRHCALTMGTLPHRYFPAPNLRATATTGCCEGGRLCGWCLRIAHAWLPQAVRQ